MRIRDVVSIRFDRMDLLFHSCPNVLNDDDVFTCTRAMYGIQGMGSLSIWRGFIPYLCIPTLYHPKQECYHAGQLPIGSLVTSQQVASLSQLLSVVNSYQTGEPYLYSML
jgi:hypothetical protein